MKRTKACGKTVKTDSGQELRNRTRAGMNVQPQQDSRSQPGGEKLCETQGYSTETFRKTGIHIILGQNGPEERLIQGFPEEAVEVPGKLVHQDIW